jgi:hypothetical protein
MTTDDLGATAGGDDEATIDPYEALPCIRIGYVHIDVDYDLLLNGLSNLNIVDKIHQT